MTQHKAYQIILQRKEGIHFSGGYFRDIWVLADAYNIPHSVALARLELGWSIDRLVNEPWGKEREKLEELKEFFETADMPMGVDGDARECIDTALLVKNLGSS